MHPLEGITVVSMEQAVAAPFATRQLADLGARVIKIERPGVGDFARHYDRSVRGEASYFIWLNRGKESVELDIKDPSDRRLLDAMIDEADVLVQNLIPGAVERLGLDASTLRARRPDLIHCSVSGYGSSGPYRSKKAYDLLVQCETGMVSVTGSPEDYAKVGVSIADIATGMYAYSGILTALYERATTGVGSTLEVAMLDALGEWMVQPAYYSVFGERPFVRTGARHASIAPYGPYRAGDGGTVFLGVQSDREWSLICAELLGRAELAQDPRFVSNTDRVANNAAITPLIEQAFATLTTDAVIDRLDQIGIASAQVRTPSEFFAHPQLEARGRWQDVDSPAGPVRSLVPPVVVEGRQPLMRRVPSLGEHNQSLREEYGAPRATDSESEGPAPRRNPQHTPDRRTGVPRGD